MQKCMPIAFELQEGSPCVFNNLPNLMDSGQKWSRIFFFSSVSCSFGETTRKEKETETKNVKRPKSIPDITQQINKWYYHFVCLSVTQFEVHSICEPSFSQQNEAAAAHKNSKQTIKYGACILHTPPRPSEISEKNWSTQMKPF